MPYCSNCNARSMRATRGACSRCYNWARAEIKAGRTTWEALEATGKFIRPPTRGERAQRLNYYNREGNCLRGQPFPE